MNKKAPPEKPIVKNKLTLPSPDKKILEALIEWLRKPWSATDEHVAAAANKILNKYDDLRKEHGQETGQVREMRQNRLPPSDSSPRPRS